ncbi:MAG: hypothetical protein GWQ08_13385 [Verrucomicrobiaceae bacterium]|nr:hypothetical protein [Verrucomicrobiaceae bacterium]
MSDTTIPRPYQKKKDLYERVPRRRCGSHEEQCQPLAQIAQELVVSVASLRSWKKPFPGASAKELWDENQNYSVDELCEAFKESRSGYYTARKRPSSQRAKENEIIVSKMKEIHSYRHLKSYGSPRMTTELDCPENRVARPTANNDLKAENKTAVAGSSSAVRFQTANEVPFLAETKLLTRRIAPS